MKKFWLLILTLLALVPSGLALGQELYRDVQGTWRAEVISIISEESRLIAGTDTEHIFQTIEARILDEERKGEIVIFDNDFIRLKEGDNFFLYYVIDVNGREYYSVRDVDRRPAILWFTALFVMAVLFLGGKQGARSLLSLAASFFVILYVLLPSLLKGFPPVPTSIILSSAILFFAIFFTHGFNRESSVAFAGTVCGVTLTGAMAYAGVYFARLSGFASDEAIYLNFNAPGLDFAGLLLGGIIIGVLGVLDDIAITQSAVVSELYGSAPNLSRKEAYKKALRVGREHVGALVNTLALAYAGAALPLLLLFSTSDSSGLSIINQEVFATEIIRTIVGSIGLILTVPITTYLAAVFLESERGRKNPGESGHTIHHHH